MSIPKIAYHIEYMTADGDSTDFVSGSGDVQTPGDSQSSFAIPPELVPNDGSKLGYLVLTCNSAANGSNWAEEHKGFSRLVVDLEAGEVSGVIASERGELDSLVTAWAFVEYPLIDLRDTPAAVPVAITESTATRVGDDTATGAERLVVQHTKMLSDFFEVREQQNPLSLVLEVSMHRSCRSCQQK